MTRWCGLLAVGIVLGVGVACSDDGEETGSTATGGSGGTATGGTTNGGTGGTTNGGTGGVPSGGTGGVTTGGAGGASGAGGSAGSLVDAAAGSGGGSAGDASMDAPIGDGGTWPDVLFQGVWFAGWAGGLDHFSWMKFTKSGQTNGQWAALDSQCTSCTGYFPCQGSDGLFSASSGSTQTLTLQYPQSCSGPTGEDWTILGFAPAQSFPPGALLTMNIQVGSGAGLNLQAFLYPASQCNAGFTSCTNPF
jgi:hypothetical protein